jgi:hypothetical protein
MCHESHDGSGLSRFSYKAAGCHTPSWRVGRLRKNCYKNSYERSDNDNKSWGKKRLGSRRRVTDYPHPNGEKYMSDQLIEFFLAKKDAFDVLTKRVEDCLRIIHELSEMFKDHPWRWISVIGADGFPSEVTETELNIDAKGSLGNNISN